MTERIGHEATGVQLFFSGSRSCAVEETAGIVAIGASTGGPGALEKILPRFPGNFPIPILIVQHMPSGFTSTFAERLNSLCSIGVREATQSQGLEAGMAYIAPAGRHMRVVKSVADHKPRIVLDSRRGKAEHMPSIDELMKSVAGLFGSRAIGVIMTGMGCDGAAGIAAIFHQGGLTIGQDESSCAVYGMPRVCAERGILRRVAPVTYIPNIILRAIRSSRQT
ncbi:MAG TPA: CheB methylesterase domain-containing protein [Candidatus Eisenbacteria bacterium]|nr:CheB methylesterase domain-containing protein [Candidatus Eisenbacteria bacterium]